MIPTKIGDDDAPEAITDDVTGAARGHEAREPRTRHWQPFATRPIPVKGHLQTVTPQPPSQQPERRPAKP
jgi:hypothetical protein